MSVKIEGRVLLVGYDFENETRESWRDSLQLAVEDGISQMLADDYPWIAFEVWANTPEWQCVAVSPAAKFVRKQKPQPDPITKLLQGVL